MTRSPQQKLEMRMLAACVFAMLISLVAAGTAGAQGVGASLKNPAALAERAPDTFKVNVDTSKGVLVIEVTRAWAPNGADRFYSLVKNGFFDQVRFFRVIARFMAQFGIHGDPAISAVWRNARIPDDPVKQSNRKGYITFATAGPGTRTTQLFINLVDNGALDAQGFVPLGRVVSGMNIVEKLYDGYGEGAPSGRGPDQGRVQMEGNAYLEKSFPKLDYVKTAAIAK